MAVLALAPAVVLIVISLFVYKTSLKSKKQNQALRERDSITNKIYELYQDKELTDEALEKELNELRPVCIFVDEELRSKWPELAHYANAEEILLKILMNIKEFDEL